MIQITDLTKNYGKSTILDRLNLTIDAGQVYCLLGKNGAGKTTLINLILDLIEKNDGSIQIFGVDHRQLDKTAKMRIGVVNEDLALIEEISGYEFLFFVGKIYNIPAETLKKRINDLFSCFMFYQ